MSQKYQPLSHCTVCNTSSPSPLQCALCHSSAYCSKLCQAIDWPVHRLLCKTLRSFPPRPNASSTLAIYLPASRAKPELLWVDREMTDDFFRGRVEGPKIMHLLNESGGPQGGAMENLIFAQNFGRKGGRKGFDLDHELVLVVRDHFLSDGSKENRCIISMTKDVVHYDFRGPAVLLRQRAKEDEEEEGPNGYTTAVGKKLELKLSMKRMELDMERMEDVKLEDLRHTVDWLNTYPENTERVSKGDNDLYLEGRNRPGR